MARIRSIKPEFWSDEKLAECSHPARLLFIGTWNFADDEGRMEYSPKRLKMQIFPADNIDVTALVGELAARKLVILYQAADREYLAIPNFRKHQRIDRPTPSKLPAPAALDSGNTPPSIHELASGDTGAFDESSPNPRRVFDECSTSARAGKERKGGEGIGINASSSELKSSSDGETISGFSGGEKSQNGRKAPIEPSIEAVNLAQLLKAEILRNKPDCRITPSQEKKWAVVADRMLRLDRRSYDDIAEVIRWAQRNEFWMANILSMDKLREKFDQLQLKRVSTGRRPTANANGEGSRQMVDVSKLVPAEPMRAPNPIAVEMTRYRGAGK